MNNYYVMAVTQDEKKRKSEAALITAGFIVFFVLCMFLIKWAIPVFEEKKPELAIEVELSLPDEPIPPPVENGGGGGGNDVKAAGAPGVAKYSPPAPGEPTPSKTVVDDNDDNKEAPAIPKHAVVKPDATKDVTSSTTKTPKPDNETPAPRMPKSVMGKTTTGTGKGGGAADDFEKSGGKGNGSGVGNGNGTGGGNGNGFGGGNGNGGGTGSGPKIVRGDRRIVRSYQFDGDLDKAVVYANISVSPEGVGKFINIAKGSSNSSNAYKEAIIRYLANIKFDKADHESMLTVQFNFMVN